ncbi:MAG TPA: serpin family protein [Bacteroidales bacterium]|nr:serpin family protein [Bacteroidales bacterium]
MKRFLVIIALVITAGFAFSCSKEKTDTITSFTPVNLSADQKQLVVQSNAFGFEFFKKVNEISGSNTNMMVSPLSVSMALGMARNGAAGTTLDAMNSTLGFAGMSDEQVNESYQHIIGTFTSLDPKVKMQIANSTWYRNGFEVEPAFISANRQYFNSEVTALDFADPASVNTINGWVSDKTNKLIPTILDQIPADAVMYLVNAVYFKGQWKYQFETANTAQKPFTLPNGTVVQAPSMNQHATFQYFKGTGFEAIELPYNQGNFVMSVLLPDAGKSVGDIIPLLSQENWNTWSKQFADRDIQLQLPKFKYAYEEKQMKPILSGMGMGVAFDADQADFTRINPEGGLYISRVLHKSYIATDEEGTEAAAVTAVEIGVTSAGPDQVYHFTVNRPFIYFIQEKSTGTILFIGTVMNPNL